MVPDSLDPGDYLIMLIFIFAYLYIYSILFFYLFY